MNTTKRHLFLAVLKVFNLGLMVVAFGISTVLTLRPQVGGMTFAEFLSLKVKLVNFLAFAAILLVWHAAFTMCGQYRSQRLASRRVLINDAFIATTIASISLGSLEFAFHIHMITFPFLLVFWFCSSMLVAGARLLIRSFLETMRVRGHNLRFILILGTNRRAIEFARRLEQTPELGYRLLGFVDERWHEPAILKVKYPLCCDFEGLAEYLRRNVVDEVANYLPLRSFYEHSAKVAALCELHGVFMRFDPRLFDLKIARARAEEFDGSAHITAHFSPLDSWPLFLKRILDVTISLALLIVLAPVLAAIGLLVKLTSDGSILFKQERLGRNKRRFFMYKFRSMVPNAENLMVGLQALNEAQGPVFKIKNDPRITPIGRFLRRTSLDELPQLFNVLRGDMSLVGPRPLPVRDYEGFNQDWQRRRFSVRPGITCLWQVNGRSKITFEHWMKLDLQYLDEWSIWLDVKILAQTIPAVMKGTGAA